MSYALLVWRNLRRNRVRFFVTSTAIGLSSALVCLMLTLPAGFDSLLSSLASESRIAVHAKAGFVYLLPPAYLNRIAQLPGVVAASSATWFGGVHDEKEGVEFANFAVDARRAMEVFENYPITPQARARFAAERQAALVGAATMERKGWKVGDRFTLRSPDYDVALELEIVGLIDNATTGDIWFHRAYLEETLRERGRELPGIGTVWVRVDGPEHVAGLLQRIDDDFATGEVQTASQTERDFNAELYGGVEGILGIVLLVTAVVGISIVFIAGNTASMTMRERAREVAVLRALGFSRRSLCGLLVSETMLQAVLAGAMGVALAFALTGVLGSMGREAGGMMAMLQAFAVDEAIAAVAMLSALVVGILAGLLPAVAAVRRSVTDVLGEVF